MPSGSRARAHDVDRLRMAAVATRRTCRRCVVACAGAARAACASPRRRPSPSSSSDAFATGSPVRSRDHRLEVQQRLQPPLRDLRLVGRVLRVPARVLQDVALDHRRRDAVRVAHADERLPDLVLAPPARAAPPARPPRRRARAGPARRRTGSPAGPSRRSARPASSTPSARSISASSLPSGPMWRAAKRRVAFEPASCAVTPPCSRRNAWYALGVEQPVQLLRVADGHLDHPALVVRILVDVFGRIGRAAS